MSDELDRRAAEIARLRDELDAARAECESGCPRSWRSYNIRTMS